MDSAQTESYIPEECELVKCESWADFESAVAHNTDANFRQLYRGQYRSTSRLSSMYERWLSLKNVNRPGLPVDDLFSKGRTGRDAIGRLELNRLRHGLRSLQGSRIQGDEDDLVVMGFGRHHGLITPLLDWTRDPHVAAYFATRDAFFQSYPGDLPTDAREIWVRFYPGQLFTSSGGPISPPHESTYVWELSLRDGVESDNFRVIDSKRLGDLVERMKAQKGVFTLLEHEVHLDIVAYLRDRRILPETLRIYEITALGCIDVLGKLRSIGLNEATLFPDVEGVARESNEGSTLDLVVRLRNH